jgi:hypothetical protein
LHCRLDRRGKGGRRIGAEAAFAQWYIRIAAVAERKRKREREQRLGKEHMSEHWAGI